MKKLLLSTAAFLTASLAFMPQASASALNTSNFIDYAATSVSTSTWLALPNQPKNTVHRLTIKDDQVGVVMQLGVGPSGGTIVNQLYYGLASGGSSTTVVYPQGISFNGASSSVWIRAVNVPATSGHSIINLLY